VHLAYIWIISHLSATNYRNLWKFDEVLTKTNRLSFLFGTRCNVEAYRPTQHILGHFRDNFYRSYYQTNSVKALKKTSWSFR